MILLKWNLNWLIKQKDGRFSFDEYLTFPDEIFHSLSQINGLKDVHVTGDGQLDSKNSQLLVRYNIDGQMILPCAVSLENVEYPFNIDSMCTFAFYKPDYEEEVVEAKRDVADLTQVVFQDIMMEIPSRVVKEGATLKTEGNGWQVIGEKQITQEEDDIDPRLAKLKDFIFEE